VPLPITKRWLLPSNAIPNGLESPWRLMNAGLMAAPVTAPYSPTVLALLLVTNRTCRPCTG
jgi:hypothetical protein